MATPSPAEQPKPRILRTPEEIFQAGWDDAAHHRPMSPDEIRKLAALLRPYLRRNRAA